MLSAVVSALSLALVLGQNVPLYNAAQPGQVMPWIGLGTGAYSPKNEGDNGKAYPECMMEIAGCGNFTIQAVKDWLTAAQAVSPSPSSPSSPSLLVRLDAADSYDTQTSVGIAMRESGLPRSSIFVLQKTGNWNPMGYADTLYQFDNLLQQMQTNYTDIVLNHWPTSPASPTVDPLCDPKKATYDEKGCRLSTWRAYVEIWKSGKSRAIGVANYAISHLQEIIDAGMPLPAVNQVPYHLYNAASPANVALLAFCKAHNIVLLSYSPLGIPDWHAFPVPQLPAATTLADPVLLQVTAAHPGATPAQVVLAWLWAQGVPSNPRTMNPAHMAENLAASALQLTSAEMALLSSRPLDLCSFDGSFYECVPTAGYEAPTSPRINRR